MYCPYCGKQIPDGAAFCTSCGAKVGAQTAGSNNAQYTTNTTTITLDNNKIARFLLTFFLWFIGSFIINHSSLKPQGYTSRTMAYFFLGIITFGIYPLIASICNLTFDPINATNIGYFKDI